jgi:hypothetical protein
MIQQGKVLGLFTKFCEQNAPKCRTCSQVIHVPLLDRSNVPNRTRENQDEESIHAMAAREATAFFGS